MVLLYLLGAFSVFGGSITIGFELFSISDFGTRQNSIINSALPGIPTPISLVIAFVGGLFLISYGIAIMNKARGNNPNDE